MTTTTTITVAAAANNNSSNNILLVKLVVIYPVDADETATLVVCYVTQRALPQQR
jgi:hypothetical protein